MTRNYAITRSSSGKPRWCDHCANAEAGILLNEHVTEDGPTVFAHACRLGAEGIVSKREDGTYRSGPCPVWVKGAQSRECRNAAGAEREMERVTFE